LIRTRTTLGKTVTVSADLGRISVLLADQDVEWTAGHRDAVLTDMDLMDAVLARHEPHRAVV